MSDTPHTPTEQEIRAEIHNQAHEPLLPVEKKLIGWSLGTGIALLILLLALGRLFPVSL
ncbi:hypothetical protein [Bordetella genomosp. 10]|uniref:hypothetical protein n=1 Tax=Bordetella genomosp. 10 TaxID=1416804 RepID=UPI0015C678B7|nr:hypothetical protein [Bordetella genomosp. 10]